MPPLPDARRIPVDAILCHTVWLLLCLLGWLGITSLNFGSFSYILDDAYIHLAVAEEIGRGNYGVNPGEFCAPSSSVLWPFLLVPFMWTSWGQFMPLVFGVVSITLTIEILLRRLRVLLPDTPGGGTRAALARILCTGAILILSNALWLVFTGLEHGLQLLVAVAAVDAILAGVAGERLRPWHYVALCAGPLVRYENLSLTGAAALFLLLQKRWQSALVVLGLPILVLAAFSAYLMANGYSALPNSVIVKSGGAVALARIPERIENGLSDPYGLLVALFVILLLGLAWVRRPWDKTGMAGLALGAAGLLHFLVRGRDLQFRYDPYILTGMFCGVIGLGIGLFPRMLPSTRLRLAAVFGLFAFTTGFHYLRAGLWIPLAGNNIHEQQHQMQRFVTEFWQRPVAVNDLGWVSYRNGNFVLDLWGLASKEALAARRTRRDGLWMDELAKEKGVDLAIIYSDWFRSLPPGWEHVGSMHLSRAAVTPARTAVDFYAIQPGQAQPVRELLRQFATTVPPGVEVRLMEPKK